jgi:hypothetical protein
MSPAFKFTDPFLSCRAMLRQTGLGVLGLSAGKLLGAPFDQDRLIGRPRLFSGAPRVAIQMLTMDSV